MNKLKVTNGPVTIPAGHQFCLTPYQLRRRQAAMKDKRTGVYESTADTQWKTGEVIETDWSIAKGMEDRVTDLNEPEPVEPTAAQQELPAVLASGSETNKDSEDPGDSEKAKKKS